MEETKKILKEILKILYDARLEAQDNQDNAQDENDMLSQKWYGGRRFGIAFACHIVEDELNKLTIE